MNDVAEVGKDVYFFGVIDCKNMVAQAYPALDLSGISTSREEEGIAEEEEEVTGECVAKEAGVDKEVVEVLGPEIAAIEVPEEAVATPKVET